MMSRMERDIGRLEAFSDGVFAFAITLLAAELKVPHIEHATAAGLFSALSGLWPSYLTLVTSFFTVLVMWVHHHQMFKMVARAGTALLFANGFLLLVVTTVPFPTALVAEYLRTPAAPAAVSYYCGTFVLVALAFYVTMMAALRGAVWPRRAAGARAAVPARLPAGSAAVSAGAFAAPSYRGWRWRSARGFGSFGR